MHQMRSSVLQNLTYDDQGTHQGLPAGNGLDHSPLQSTPRRDNNGFSGNYGRASPFGQSKPYMSSISRPSSQNPSKYSIGPPNATYVPARSPSPLKMPLSSGHSPTKFADVENSTMQRQRKELQLLINELKDRDRELNEMSESHQKQLISWETDKRRVLILEKQFPKLKADLLKRTEQARALKERLRISEHSAHSKTRELETTQMHLQQASDQASISSHQVEELTDRNENMAKSIQELSTSLGQSQAKEQELNTTLKLKECELSDANEKLKEVTKRAKTLHSSLQESRKNEAVLRTERDQWKEQYQANKHEIEKLRADISNHYSNEDGYQAELSQVKQELLAAQKELFLAGEREKRKDQLLELNKSKQERTETELQNLRQVFERQQKELMYLQQQFQNQDVTDKMSELNTDDDFSDISSLLKPSAKLGDEGFADLEHFNFQEPSSSSDFKGRHLYKDRSLFANNTLSVVGPVSVDRKSLEKEFSASEKALYIDTSPSKAGIDDTGTDKLQKLLEESKKMANSLEAYSPISSPYSTPERKGIRNRSTEESFLTPMDARRRSPRTNDAGDGDV